MNSKLLSIISLGVSLASAAYVAVNLKNLSNNKGLIDGSSLKSGEALSCDPTKVCGPNTSSASKDSTELRSALSDLSHQLIAVSESVKPSVVTVSTEKIYTQRINPFSFFNSPFDGFFGDFFGAPQERKYKASGLGSGVIVNEDGTILTNNHVVAEADTIMVGTLDNRALKAKVVGRDPKTDIAVLKVQASGLKAVSLGDSDHLRVGEIVLAVGSPMNKGLAHTVTQGIVSAVGRANVGLAEYEDFIQTDAAINPGNSGGALVSLEGKLVGINTAIASQSGGNQGIGFAVPVNMARGVMESLLSSGKVVRGWIGVASQDMNEELQKAMGLSISSGALVSDVAKGSPAEQAGLGRGDVVIKLNGDQISQSSQFRNRVATSRPGSVLQLEVLRKNQNLKLQVKVSEPSKAADFEDEFERWGMKVVSVSASVANRYRLKPGAKGVVIASIDEESEILETGLQEGDLIQAVNQKPIENIETFERITSNIQPGQAVMIQIRRGNANFITSFRAP